MEGWVVRICIAPVKALHVVSPDEVELTHTGVVGDRRFWLLDRDRRLVNGKRHPELMRVQPEWDESSRRLALAFPDGSVVEDEVQPGELFEAELYGTPHASRRVCQRFRTSSGVVQASALGIRATYPPPGQRRRKSHAASPAVPLA